MGGAPDEFLPVRKHLCTNMLSVSRHCCLGVGALPKGPSVPQSLGMGGVRGRGPPAAREGAPGRCSVQAGGGAGAEE